MAAFELRRAREETRGRTGVGVFIRADRDVMRVKFGGIASDPEPSSEGSWSLRRGEEQRGGTPVNCRLAT
jgi:hypothetical protein